MDDPRKQRLRNYAWGYFAIHAEQRMKTFNFYLILSTALISAFFLGLTRISNHIFLIPIGFLFSLVSFLFWKLDCRNKQLVRNGENALKFLDNLENPGKENEQPHVLNIFAYDDWNLAKNKQKKFVKQDKQPCFFSFFNSNMLNLISYSQIFNMIFLTFGIFGIMMIGFSLIPM